MKFANTCITVYRIGILVVPLTPQTTLQHPVTLTAGVVTITILFVPPTQKATGLSMLIRA